MTDLAARAFSSRSAMTRRVDRLVEEGLVRRTSSDADGRGVVIALTETGLARLRRRCPFTSRACRSCSSSNSTIEELEVLERALEKVSLNCSFG